MKILSKNSGETVDLGENLALSLKGGEVVALYGDLGGGKTQFTKGIALGLGIKDDIISPTFVIRKEYRLDSRLRGNDREKNAMRRDYGGKNLNLLHYDFYRFETPDRELIETLTEGISPENITVIEWAERVEQYLPEDTIKVHFKYVSVDEREIELLPLSFWT